MIYHPKHPEKLRWNWKMRVWKMIFLSNWVIFKFHFRDVSSHKMINSHQHPAGLLEELQKLSQDQEERESGKKTSKC